MGDLQREAEKGLALAARAERQGRILRSTGLSMLAAAVLGGAAVIATGIADAHFAVVLGVAAVIAFLGYQLAGAGSANLAAAARARDVARRALSAGEAEDEGDTDDAADRESEDSSSVD